MKLYLAGSEIPSHRKVLTEVGAKNAALSFMGLRRRIKHLSDWHVADKFPEEMHLLLDSGAYTVNKSPMDYTQKDLKEIYEQYQQFATDNLDRFDAVVEFDAMALGREWIEEQRDSYWTSIDTNKFIPVWHPEWGVDYLKEMAGKYVNIGIPTTDIEGRNLTPVLNGLAHEGVQLHGVGMTKPDDMSNIKWYSVSSTSWVSPQQYGDTIIWTGRELKRYPKKSKEQARKRYRTLLQREGFDAEKIANDDSTEVLRLSIWSWEKLVEDIEHRHSQGLNLVTNLPETDEDDFAQEGGDLVDNHTPQTLNPVSTRVPVRIRNPIPLPVLGFTTQEEVDEETGEVTEERNYHIRSESQRVCDSCFLANKCPAFEPGSNCAYNIPLQIRTREQLASSFNGFVEMQAQRVLFLRFAEEMEGGYADPNLSNEMDRLTKMIKAKVDMETEGFSFKIEGKQIGPGTGAQGVIGRMFGDQASQRAQQLEAPIKVEQMAEAVEEEFSG